MNIVTIELYANNPPRLAWWCLSHGWGILESDPQPLGLRYQGGIGFFEHTGTVWKRVDEAVVRSRVASVLSSESISLRLRPGGLPTVATARIVTEIVEAIKNQVVLASDITAPAIIYPVFATRLTEFQDPHPANLLPLQNGVLNVLTGDFFPPTPALWTFAVADYRYDQDATCPRWERVLKEDWGLSRRDRRLLRQFFGYCLAGGLAQFHVAMLLIGPPRAGKSLILRILQEMIGPDNCATPTFDSLGTRFGMSDLVGKRVAGITDARLSSRTDQAVLAENILTLTGEDRVRIERKHVPALNAQQLSCKLVVVSNEVPGIRDVSGAVAARFRVIRLPHSFLGRENPKLFEEELRPELPGILNWAMGGLADLLKTGVFVNTKNSREAVAELAAAASPVRGFVEERCWIDAAAVVLRDHLFAAFQSWCAKAGVDHPPTREHFGRDLHAAVPGLKPGQHRVNGRSCWVYKGIQLR